MCPSAQTLTRDARTHNLPGLGMLRFLMEIHAGWLFDQEGDVLIEPDSSQSTCFDPFRGVTVPDEGSYSVSKDCTVSFALIVEGATVELYGRVVQPRIFGTGIYVTYIPEVFAEKGSFNMVRVK